jgi:hypothetical protein
MLPIEQIRSQYGHSMAIIIEACRVHFGTTSLQELNNLLDQAGVNFPEIALHSRLHRIRPVVFRILLQANCPENFKARLKTELHSITLNNFSIAKETERIIQSLAQLGVSALPYKGVAYSKQFYGDISMRESSDIDLVLEPDQLEKTFSFFEKDGYSMFLGEDVRRNSLKAFMEQNKDLCFDKKTKEGPGFHVELHWEVTHPRYLAPKHLNQFDRTNTRLEKIIAEDHYFLNPAEHIRAICLHHMVHDGIEYIKTLIDLAQGIKEHDSIGDRLLLQKKIQEMNAHYEMGAILLSIENLFGIPSNYSIEYTTASQKASEHILDYNLSSTVGKYQRHRIFSLINHYRRTVKNRIIFIRNQREKNIFIKQYWANVLSPQQAELEWVKLPRFLYFLYFIIRPVRIALRKKSDG